MKKIITETFEPSLEEHVGVYLVAKEVKSRRKKNIARQKKEDTENPEIWGVFQKNLFYTTITRGGFPSKLN